MCLVSLQELKCDNVTLNALFYLYVTVERDHPYNQLAKWPRCDLSLTMTLFNSLPTLSFYNYYTSYKNKTAVPLKTAKKMTLKSPQKSMQRECDTFLLHRKSRILQFFKVIIIDT